MKQPLQKKDEPKNMWVDLASNAFIQSTSFTDTNYRTQWENNIRHFNNKHHLGSKYNKASYRYKSRFFRPKTRSAIRKNEADAAAAFFGNMDVVSVEPWNKNDLYEVAAGELQQGVLQYRLTETIPWFLVCIGGFQDAQKIGVVISYQDWLYKEKLSMRKVPQTDEFGRQLYENGKPLMAEIEEREIIEDRPIIELRPVENIRIHPASNWLDPINSSPYVIDLIPMYVHDVKLKMEKPNPKTGRKWKKIEDGVLLSATKQVYDSTRQTREGDRTDKFDPTGTGKLSEYDTVWVHRNIFRIEDEDIIFYTLGTEHLLTDPVFLEEEYKHGKRPYVMGTAVIETHKIYPSGVGQLGEGIQKEINENANSRADNVKLVMNKRYFVNRGAQVDLSTLMKNVAASVTLMNDVDKDVKDVSFDDVTGSAYMEQDRLNLDHDDVTGAFSPSTIQSNRKLNETVGGMAMIKGTSTSLGEYLIRTFGETWVEKVLKQLLSLERVYESDETILQIAANTSPTILKIFGPNPPTAELLKLLEYNLKTTVNVGQGATDPISKVNNFRLGLKSVSDTLKESPQGLWDQEELVKEIMGRIGYRDGSRFLAAKDGQDPEKLQLMQIVQMLQQKLESKMDEIQAKLTVQQMKDEAEMRRLVKQIVADIQLKMMDTREAVLIENMRGQHQEHDRT